MRTTVGGVIGGLMPNDAITAAELARRYGLTMIKAHQWMRELPHWKLGRSRFTSEAMLAGWLAAHLKNSPAVRTFDPLQDAVVNHSIALIQMLIQQGHLSLRPQSNDRADSVLCMEPATRP